jgi:acetolactate synthase-1/3 small subunit
MRYECTISVLVENQSSILTRILGLLTSRGFEIYTVAIGAAEYERMSRITLVLPGNNLIIDQITKQLYKLLPVVKVQNLTVIPAIKRELVLFKIFVPVNDRSEILEISTFFRAKILDFTESVLTLEVTGEPEKIIAIEQLVNKFRILEIARTGRIALSRDSLIYTKLVKKPRKRSRLKQLGLSKSKDVKTAKSKKLIRSYLTNTEG